MHISYKSDNLLFVTENDALFRIRYYKKQKKEK